MRQSTYDKWVQPAWLLIVLGLAVPVGTAGAQDRYEVNRRENFRREPSPSGRLLGALEPGAEVAGLQTRDGWVQVTVEGWIWERSLRAAGADEEFDVEVIPPAGENLRESPNGLTIGRLGRGFLAQELERSDGWVRISRTGWIYGPSLTSISTGAAVPPPVAQQPAPVAGAGSGAASLDYAVTDRQAIVHREVDGDTSGTMASGTPVRIVSRAGSWVKIQTEGWVREEDLRPPVEDVLVGVSGAEVRATPSGFVGRTVQWRVQYLSTKTGTGLRPLIPEGSRYMLVRGPLPEATFVYVVLDPEHVGRLARVQGIAELVILGRVLGVSRYLGNPVLQLIDMQVRNP